MCAPIPLRDVVGVTKHLLLEAIIPLHRHFNANVVIFALRGKVKNLIQLRLVLVQVLHERLQATVVDEHVFFARALINQVDLHAGIQKCQFPQALGQNIMGKVQVAEGLCGRLEVTFGAALVGLTHFLQRCYRHAIAIFLLIYTVITPDGQAQHLRKGVYNRNPDAM